MALARTPRCCRRAGPLGPALCLAACDLPASVLAGGSQARRIDAQRASQNDIASVGSEGQLWCSAQGPPAGGGRPAWTTRAMAYRSVERHAAAGRGTSARGLPSANAGYPTFSSSTARSRAPDEGRTAQRKSVAGPPLDEAVLPCTRQPSATRATVTRSTSTPRSPLAPVTERSAATARRQATTAALSPSPESGRSLEQPGLSSRAIAAHAGSSVAPLLLRTRLRRAENLQNTTQRGTGPDARQAGRTALPVSFFQRRDCPGRLD